MTTKTATLDRTKFPLEVQATSGVGSVAVAAAAEEKSPPTLCVLAYSGGPLDLGYCTMYCDADGATLPASMPILRQHDAAKIVGQSCSPIEKAASGAITIKAAFMPTVHAAEVRDCAAAGMRWQASMGFRPDYESAQWLDSADAKSSVNGRDVCGPNVVIARKWSLKEASIVPLGADGQTSATVMAFADPQQIKQNRRNPMAEPTSATVQQLRAAFPDAEDREFVLAQLEAGATLEQANAAYVSVLRDRLIAAKAAPAPAPAAAAKPAPSPRQAVPINAGAFPSAPSGISAMIAAGLPLTAGPATVNYFEAVSAFEAKGLSKFDAQASVARNYPGVHEAYLTEANSGKEWKHFPMKTASGEVRR